MEILKLVLIFCVIAAILHFKKPLYAAILSATLATGLLFLIPPAQLFSTLWGTITSWQTISILLLFYIVMFLQNMLDQRGYLLLARQSLDNLFHNRRVTASLAPIFLGLLPSPSVMTICGEIVDESAGDAFSREEKAFVASYFRHVPESILPTFNSIIIAISLTQGRVTVAGFVLGMLPMALALVLLGYLFFLRRIPKDTGLPPSEDKRKDLLNLLRGCWPLVLIIVLVLLIDAPVFLFVAGTVLLFALVDRFQFAALKPLFRKSLDVRMLLTFFCILLFKDVLNATGVMNTLPALFAGLPLPDILIFAMVFFVGTILSGSQAIAALGIPLAIMAIPDFGLAHFVLLMGMAYAAHEITPTHVCVVIATEYFNVNFGALVRKGLPVIAAFCAVLLGYFYLLNQFI